MISLDLVTANLLSPMILCFALGAVAGLLKSDLRLPAPAYDSLAIYLLLAIGLKGGVSIAQAGVGAVSVPLAVAAILGGLIPLYVFAFCRKVAKMSRADAGAQAAHYGSVSAVTFMAASVFLEQAGMPPPSFAAAMLAVMEIPGIVVGLVLAKGRDQNLSGAIHEVFTGRGVILLAGGLVIGALTGPTQYEMVKPFFEVPFRGALCLFLLEMGVVAAAQAGALKGSRRKLLAVGLGMPLVGSVVALGIAKIAGLDTATAAILAVLAASASYIAAPAAVRVALPQANPGLYLATSIGLTFPFNLAVGIPLYSAMAQAWIR